MFAPLPMKILALKFVTEEEKKEAGKAFGVSLNEANEALALLQEREPAFFNYIMSCIKNGLENDSNCYGWLFWIEQLFLDAKSEEPVYIEIAPCKHRKAPVFLKGNLEVYKPFATYIKKYIQIITRPHFANTHLGLEQTSSLIRALSQIQKPLPSNMKFWHFCPE